LLKKAHLLCCPHISSLRRTSMYVSFLKISGASQSVGLVSFADPKRSIRRRLRPTFSEASKEAGRTLLSNL
jgi:hypothetical protein